jgi:hypothetical protein
VLSYLVLFGALIKMFRFSFELKDLK